MKGTADKTKYTGVDKKRLGIEVTTRCNIDCSHCFARAGISKPASLSLRVAKEIIDEGYAVGYRHLHITGGEPLLWDGLPDILDHAFLLGYKTVFLNSNGTLLTEKINGQLAEYDGLSVSVSLEGTAELHGTLRGNGSYAQTLLGIEKALSADIELSVFTVACKSLITKLPRFADDIHTRFPGVHELVLIQLFPPQDSGFSLAQELLEPQDFLQLVDIVSLLNLLGLKTGFLNNPLAFAASKLLETHWVPPSAPLYAEGSMFVTASQDMCLSHSSRDSFAVYEAGMIQKVLDSEQYRKKVAPDQTTCPSCRYTELCLNSGMLRPSEFSWGSRPDLPYCQMVLDCIAH